LAEKDKVMAKAYEPHSAQHRVSHGLPRFRAIRRLFDGRYQASNVGISLFLIPSFAGVSPNRQ
jgi:hypothetical protein